MTSILLQRRFARVLCALDAGVLSDPAIEIPIRLVADLAVLHKKDLAAAASTAAQTYRDGTVCMLEWPRGAGLIDRRMLSPRLVESIAHHGGPALTERDWSAAVRVLRDTYGTVDSHSLWIQFILDAREWWLDHLPPVVMGHVTREAVFQPLPRRALARRAILRRQR
jgi:hypothetical protein